MVGGRSVQLPRLWCLLRYPKYSPDLNPLDYFVWSEVERRMGEQKAPSRESAAAYRARLRRTAKSIPAGVIKKALAQMKKRAAAVVKAGGGDIHLD